MRDVKMGSVTNKPRTGEGDTKSGPYGGVENPRDRGRGRSLPGEPGRTTPGTHKGTLEGNPNGYPREVVPCA